MARMNHYESFVRMASDEIAQMNHEAVKADSTPLTSQNDIEGFYAKVWELAQKHSLHIADYIRGASHGQRFELVKKINARAAERLEALKEEENSKPIVSPLRIELSRLEAVTSTLAGISKRLESMNGLLDEDTRFQLLRAESFLHVVEAEMVRLVSEEKENE